MDTIILRNKVTGAESTVPLQLWEQKRHDRQWKNVFIEVRRIIEPPEVVALKKRLSAQNK